MDIAIPLFDRFTALDAVGPYEVLSRLPGAERHLRRRRGRPMRTETGMLALIADAALDGPAAPGDPRRAGRHRHRRAAGRRAPRGLDPHGARVVRVDHLRLHRLAAARRRRVLEGLEATTHWLDLDELEQLRRAARRAPRGGAGQGHHRRGRVLRDRHGAHARRADRGRRRGEGDPAGDRVRPRSRRSTRAPRAPPRRRRSSSCAQSWRPGRRRSGKLPCEAPGIPPGCASTRGCWPPSRS